MPKFAPRLWAAFAGLALSLFGVWHLENQRRGLAITPLMVGTTPATIYKRSGFTEGPAVVIAHGFAGSRQIMEAYALTLAHAGYAAVSFDFEGHGRNPAPMSGDVTRIDGTTQFLMRETARVVEAARAIPGVEGRVALLGHSMASDILVRCAKADPGIKATVAISMFSEAVTAAEPKNLLMISGEWESFLRADALRNARLFDPAAEEGKTVGDPPENGRRTFVAPHAEHVRVLYSGAALAEARAWLDTVFGRTSSSSVASTGGAIVLLLSGLVLLAWPLASVLPRFEHPPDAIAFKTVLLASLIPAALPPLALRVIDTRFLPVLVADYLTVHLLVYGLVALAIMMWRGVRIGHISWLSGLAFAAYGIFVFGGALDRYVASFMPNPERLVVIAAIAARSVPYMLSESLLIEGGRASLSRVLLVRSSFLASLVAAVALDFERLMFLLIIIPIIVIFFVIFGLMGGWVGRRTLSPPAAGIGLGLILAWSLGVSFPMFLPS